MCSLHISVLCCVISASATHVLVYPRVLFKILPATDQYSLYRLRSQSHPLHALPIPQLAPLSAMIRNRHNVFVGWPKDAQAADMTEAAQRMLSLALRCMSGKRWACRRRFWSALMNHNELRYIDMSTSNRRANQSLNLVK